MQPKDFNCLLLTIFVIFSKSWHLRLTHTFLVCSLITRLNLIPSMHIKLQW